MAVSVENVAVTPGPNEPAVALHTDMTTIVSPDGTRIGYESAGAGPPLLLVHGSTGTRARWSPVLPALTERYAVHAMDRRGRGLSAAEIEPYSLGREAEDVAAIAETLGGNVYVLGHSYGGVGGPGSCPHHTRFPPDHALRATDTVARPRRRLTRGRGTHHQDVRPPRNP